MHNIRPAGQMWPVKAFNLVHTAKIFVILPCLFVKNISFDVVKTYYFVP